MHKTNHVRGHISRIGTFVLFILFLASCQSLQSDRIEEALQGDQPQATIAAVATQSPNQEATATAELPPSPTPETPASPTPEALPSPSPTSSPQEHQVDKPTLQLKRTNYTSNLPEDSVPDEIAIDIAAICNPDFSLNRDLRTAENLVVPGLVYSIQEGDSLAAIAHLAFGESIAYKDIVAFNNDRVTAIGDVDFIENPSLIRRSMNIYIPTLDEINGETSKSAPASRLEIETDLTQIPSTAIIRMAGSSTVFPIVERLARCYIAAGFPGVIEIQSIGTFGGLEEFCQSNTQLVNASAVLDLTDWQKENCPSLGIDFATEFLPFEIGTDAVTMVTNPNNPCNSLLESADVVTLEAVIGQYNRWSEIEGCNYDLPITRFYPSPESGTFRFVTTQVSNLDNVSNIIDEVDRENDEELAEAVATVENGLGFFGITFYESQSDRLFQLPVNGARPDRERASDVEVDQDATTSVDIAIEPYPFFRPLFIYTSIEQLTQDHVATFVSFALQTVNHHITDLKYFPMSIRAHERDVTQFCRHRPDLCSP